MGCFGILFTLEVVVKVTVLRTSFVHSLWNLYDTIIVLLWLLQVSASFSMLISPFLLRLGRIGRFLRLLRFVKAFQIFDVLHLLVHSLHACMSALLWSMVLLSLLMLITGLILHAQLQDVYQDESIPYEGRKEVFRYFGTFTLSLFSMYEITLGNFIPVIRTVTENVSEWYVIFFLTYRTAVGFAVLNVINAIFNAETYRVATADDNIMMLHRERQLRLHTNRMQRLMNEADSSNDGRLSMEEFKEILTDPNVQNWFEAQDIRVQDADLAFQIIDVDGDGHLSVEELVRGLSRLKGPARSMDLVFMIHAFHYMESLMQDTAQNVAKIEKRKSLNGASVPMGRTKTTLQATISQGFNNHRDDNGKSF